jgi:organic hydroperoxide reductase OsmC/OhrA
MGHHLDTEFGTTLEQVKDFTFTVIFDKESMKTLTLDEPPPLGAGNGPNASRVLASAVGHCLSASLLFCLQKARIPMKHVSTKVHTTLAKNERGRWRVQGMKVDIKAEPVNEENREQMKRCLDLFEDFCIVTQSVRKGIDVKVQVQT